MKTYTLPGTPIPLMRARCGRSKVWDAQKAIKFSAGILIKTQHEDLPLYTGPLHLNATFHFQPPGSLSQRKQSALLNTYKTSKPDTDNLIKFLCDVCSNNILYHDDSTIVSISAKKIYSLKEFTEFSITELNHETNVSNRKI